MKSSLYTAAQCREIDQTAMQVLNVTGLQLMDRAAEAAMSVLAQQWPEAKRLSVYCGPGNNGGDGYLLAAKAHQLGYSVVVTVVIPPVSELAKQTHEYARAEGVELTDFDKDSLSPDSDADIVIDAIFGHGLARPVEGVLAQLFEGLSQSPLPVLALDIPSGLNSDNGAVMGVAIRAEASCSFIAPKLGMYTAQGPDYSGLITEHRLGVNARIYSQIPPACECIDVNLLRRLLPVPKLASHKGDFGHVAVVGGHPGMVGAVILAAMAAARSGAGRVTVASDESHIQLIQQHSPVLMTQQILPDGRVELPASINAIVLGPGLGCAVPDIPLESQRHWSLAVFESVLKQAIENKLALIVDADALTLLAKFPRLYSHWVLSPHPKEAATLLGRKVSDIEADRPAACAEIAQRYGGVCILKGKGSLVSDGGKHLSLCSDGNWGMATAGSGDVLSGIIGAFLATGIEPYDAARLAVGVHAQAGDAAAQLIAKRSMIATDLIAHLSTVFKAID